MYFASDNTGPVHPLIMATLAEANQGYAAPYGADPITAAAIEAVRHVFEAPDASVCFVALGTAANAIALAALAQPDQAIFCSEVAHIFEDECNAPEFLSGGARLVPIAGGDKITPDALKEAILREGNPGGVLSLTSVTERGGVYDLHALETLSRIAHDAGLKVHLDGARFSNACAALGCSAAEMSWKIGIDALSFGGTKNGLMAVEAIVFFDRAYHDKVDVLRKRAAHLFSKHRFIAAQMRAFCEGDLWRTLGASANGKFKRLLDGLTSVCAVEMQHAAEANLGFLRLTRGTHQALKAGGAQYYLLEGPLEHGDPQEMLACRLVCDWSISDTDIDRFVDIAAQASS